MEADERRERREQLMAEEKRRAREEEREARRKARAEQRRREKEENGEAMLVTFADAIQAAREGRFAHFLSLVESVGHYHPHSPLRRVLSPPTKGLHPSSGVGWRAFMAGQGVMRPP